jgi:hypothetical protein
MRWWDEECFDEFDVADPMEHERIVPVDDEEAERFEAICRAATPGPLVIDDQSEGDGVLVATLPDGRLIVSQRSLDERESHAAIDANAQLICRARCMVLRMVHDRLCWHEREQQLIEKIQRLESELERVRAEQGMVVAGGAVPTQPR